jgi:hypothetical protein
VDIARVRLGLTDCSRSPDEARSAAAGPVPTRNAVLVVSIEVKGSLEEALLVVSVVVSLLHSFRLMIRSRAALHLSRRRGAAGARPFRSSKPETVVAWHRRDFRLFWTWKSRHRTGRPTVPHDVRALIREISTANPLL